MSNINLFVGGAPVLNVPSDGARTYAPPHAGRVAAEYANGYFTLGWELAPSRQDYQRVALDKVSPAVGDVILMYVIPEEHMLTHVVARVNRVDSKFAGATLKPSAVIYDKEAGTYANSTLLDAMFDNLTLTTASSAFANVSVADAKKNTGGYFVPKGKTLILGFKITALPTDRSNKFSRMKASVSLACKVSGFNIPGLV